MHAGRGPCIPTACTEKRFIIMSSQVFVKRPGRDGGATDVEAGPSQKPELDSTQDGTGSLFWTKPWYALGSQIKGRTAGEIYMNDNAVRARAGLLNITAWVVFCLLLTSDNPQFLSYTIGPVVGWDMLAASIFGLVPLSPYGVLGTLLAWNAKPVWKPAGPKRFAWSLGVGMVTTCVLLGQFRLRNAAIAVNLACITLTWLEAVLGFCLGCWTWNNVMVPLLGKKKCAECTMDVPKQGTVARVKEVQDITRQHPLVVFSKSFCPHCQRAKGLLEQLGAPYQVINSAYPPQPCTTLHNPPQPCTTLHNPEQP